MGAETTVRAALLARVSTDMQAEEGLSIPAQLAEMREFCEKRGWTVAAEFIAAGYTGRTMDRPGLQGLLAALDQRVFDVVVVHELSRLSRSIFDTFDLFETFGRYDVGFASVKEPNFDFTTPTGKLFLTLMAALNQYYLDLLRMHTAKGKRERARQGLYNASIIPFGYKAAGDAKTPPVLAPQAADGVRQAFEAGGVQSLEVRVVHRVAAAQGERVLQNGQAVKGAVDETGLAGDDGLPAAVVGECAGLFERVAEFDQPLDHDLLVVGRDDAAAVPLHLRHAAKQALGGVAVEPDGDREIADVQFLDHVEHEVGDVVGDVRAVGSDAAEHDVLVMLGVAGPAGVKRANPLAALNPEMGQEFARLVQGDAPFGEVAFEVGSQHGVKASDARPRAHKPLERVHEPQRLHGFAEGLGRVFGDIAQGFAHIEVMLPLFAPRRLSEPGEFVHIAPVPDPGRAQAQEHGSQHVFAAARSRAEMGGIAPARGVPERGFKRQYRLLTDALTDKAADAERRAALQQAGYRVEEFTDTEVWFDPRGTVRRLRALAR